MKPGQKVICVKSHPVGVVTKGQIYTIKSIHKPCCTIFFDVGIESDYSNIQICSTCHFVWLEPTRWLLHSNRFSPIEEKSETSSVNEYGFVLEGVEL